MKVRKAFRIFLLCLGLLAALIVARCGGNSSGGGFFPPPNNGSNQNPGNNPGGGVLPTPTPGFFPTPTPTPFPNVNPVLQPLRFFTPNVSNGSKLSFFDTRAMFADCLRDRLVQVELTNGAVTDPKLLTTPPVGSCPSDFFQDFSGAFLGYVGRQEVSRLDLVSSQVIGTYTSSAAGILSRPHLLTFTNNLLFVLDERFLENDRVIVIDPVLGLVVHQIILTQEGSRAIYSKGRWVYVVNGGTTGFCLPPNCVNGFGVDIIDAQNAMASNHPTFNIPLFFSLSGNNPGAPTQIAVGANDDIAFLGTDNGWLYRLDLVNRTVIHGPQNPIVISAQPGVNRVRVAMDELQGATWVTSENPESISLLNVSTEIPLITFSLNTNPAVFEGPFQIGLINPGFGTFRDVIIYAEGIHAFHKVQTD